MIEFSPYAKFRELPFGFVHLELGVRATNDEDPVHELTSIYKRRICRNEFVANEYYEGFAAFYANAEDDEFLGA